MSNKLPTSFKETTAIIPSCKEAVNKLGFLINDDLLLKRFNDHIRPLHNQDGESRTNPIEQNK
jgi:hypothetical protein